MPWFRVLLNEHQVARSEVNCLAHQIEGLLDCADHDGVAVFTAPHHGGGIDCYFSPVAASLARGVIAHYQGEPCAAPHGEDLHTLVGQKGARQKLLQAPEPGPH